MLFVPPFGEEMNKCRRQVTETAKALMAGGCASLVVDLYGTGDSNGEFAEASWPAWKADIVSAMNWSEIKGLPVEALVATRLGCALAAESLRESGRMVERTVFWHPVANGKQFITQFLRLRVAASMMMEADERETVEALKERLKNGQCVEVAGYPLTGKLWNSIENIELLTLMDNSLGNVTIFEVGRTRERKVSNVAERLAAHAHAQGGEVRTQRIAGEPFWSSTEIVVNPGLTRLTAEYLLQNGGT